MIDEIYILLNVCFAALACVVLWLLVTNREDK